ncbi:unnamed protein product [Mycena citricolor]|uniref:Uncharacterized protein n=1 Tax=Mycena citricolor TaxID=2018698 RepID=A0AAD2HUC3_9AGAR|nr:unnamed protein product [Mycena citricolor]
MPKAMAAPARPLPTSAFDFHLPGSSSSSSSASLNTATFLDDTSTVVQRFRRPSLLAPKSALAADTRMHSPLTAYKVHTRRLSQSTTNVDDCDPLWGDPLPSRSGNSTPPLTADTVDDSRRSMPPATPPRRSLSRSSDRSEARFKARRLSFPVKPPRILNLLAESRPLENEVQSEAAFQRLLASGVDLPRTPRTIADRGRYPEEAVQEEYPRDDDSSDSEDDDESTYTSFALPISGTEPINIRTPAGSVNGDDMSGMCISESPGQGSMDVDVIAFRLALSVFAVVHVYQSLAIDAASDQQCRAVE